MAIKIALAGNPNSGKTTMFNDLTGSNQYVGNWPGVTVEKKEGKLKGAEDIIIQDLPGIYSLSPYTMEEVVARSYLVNEKPDVILNIVDASNIERNLYLTTQLAELGIPMVIALNMIDVARKNGDKIDLDTLGKALGCHVIETSALKGEGSLAAAKKAAEVAGDKVFSNPPHVFGGSVEHALAHIEDLITHNNGEEPVHHHHGDGSIHEGEMVDPRQARWFAIKLFERDSRVLEKLNLTESAKLGIEETIRCCEMELDDDAESIITNERYNYISRVVEKCVKKGRPKGALSTSDKIDRIVTNKYFALPIFAAIMYLVYYIAVSSVGTIVTDFANDVLVAQWIQAPLVSWLEKIGTAGWLVGLIGDGIIGGVGAVLGFVPQLIVLFFLLSILEDVGYMARVAFIMDRIFRKFGLSGKSFIPLLIASGCGVPGIMASRTIESEGDRRMTIITTTFIPCSAKLPIIGLIASALFGGAAWIGVSAYFIGIAAVVVSGLILKKTKPFSGKPAPFVMELPAYHVPSWKNVLSSVWERGWSFIKRAGTVILLSSIIIWFASSYGWTDNAEVAGENEAERKFAAVENSEDSVLGVVGGAVAPVFRPLGFDSWEPTVATIMGLVAKEEIVGVFGVVYNVDTEEEGTQDILDSESYSTDEKAGRLSNIKNGFDKTSGGYGGLAAFSFLLFNLLCAPCFAAMGAIKREMNSGKWTAFAIAYQCSFAYLIAMIVYQLSRWFAGAGFTLTTAVSILAVLFLAYMLLRKNRYKEA